VGDHWQDGWRIPNPIDTGHPVEVHGAMKAISVTGPTAVVYLPNGRVKGTDVPSFEFTAPRVDTRSCVQVDLSGRPYQKREAC
jgi:type IV fimbrial biogenesis protein FimT